MNLSTEDTQLFYKLRWALLAYANRHLKVIPQATAAEEISKQPVEQIAKLRDALYAKPNLLERFVAENPERFSPQELIIVASWRHRVSGDFYIMRHLKPYTVFMSGKGPTHLYGVLGLCDPLEVVTGGAPLPILAQATLLPFRDRIVYDGILNFYRITFGRGIRTSLTEEYNRLKEREGIIEQLAGPTGEAQMRTSLDRKAPRKPAPDWRPAVDEIVAQTEKMRQTDTKLQGAAFGLLRAAASLAQATLQEKDAEAEATRRLRSVRTALTKLEKLLYEEEYG
ncbi:MAG: hypothetical protein WBW48_00100 [Anaerolineae bacterium]